jgi:hypothetical protein
MTPMPCSHAQVEANRKNALSSTGPRTTDGKAKSRANSLKHGLTGAGIVLPTEDAEELDARFATLESEMKPRNEIARQLMLRIVLLLVRLDRSAVHEARATAHRMRKAQAEFDDARLAEAENYYSWIASEPATNARRLRSSPEGIDILVGAMEGLQSDLKHPDGYRWDWQHCEQFHHLLGLRRMDVPVTRARALTEALGGNFKFLGQADRPDLDKEKRPLWALVALVELIDGEIASLKALREGLDLEGIEFDRAEAAQRAIFDASPEAVLARKYESASERGLYRAFKEFREVQGDSPEVEIKQELEADPAEELASSLPEPLGEDSAETNIDSIVVETSVEDVAPVAKRRPKPDSKAPGRRKRRAAGRP